MSKENKLMTIDEAEKAWRESIEKMVEAYWEKLGATFDKGLDGYIDEKGASIKDKDEFTFYEADCTGPERSNPTSGER